VANKEGREPDKFHFVKGFHRGLELFDQNGKQRLQDRAYRDALRGLGLIVVEGSKDVIVLDALGVPSVGLCSNMMTDARVKKVVRWAKDLAGGLVTLMLDCDPEGENGIKQALWQVAQYCRVRLAWSSEMFGWRFKGRQPEVLARDDWIVLISR
jgi:hypothetical protein